MGHTGGFVIRSTLLFLMDVAGVGLLTANWALLLSGVLAFALIVIRTTTEERNLIERFGEDYRDSIRRVGRFFPRPMG